MSSKTNPSIKLPTRNDAELLLNDMEVGQLPHALKKIVPPGWKGKQLGRYIRQEDPEAFDLWFTNVYYKNHLRT